MTGRAEDLDADYAKAGYGGRIGFGERPALIVVDFVQAYLDKESPLYAGVEPELEQAGRVLDAARAAGIPVIYTDVQYSEDGSNGGVFYRKVGVLKVYHPGSPFGEIAPRLAPLPSELVVTKQYPSAFFGTSIQSTLTAMGVDTTIIIGLSTSGCIRATVVDAMSYGFIPVVVRDAVGDRDERVHEANLFDMQAKYADVIMADEVVEFLASYRAPAR